MAHEAWSDEDVVPEAAGVPAWSDADVVAVLPTMPAARAEGLGATAGRVGRAGARGAALGVAGLPNYVADLAVRGTNSLGLTQAELPSTRFERFLTQLGLPAPQSNLERFVGGTTEMLGGMYGPGVGSIAKAMPGRLPPVAPTAADVARQNALAAGYKLAPTEVRKTPIGNILESLSFPSKLRQELGVINQRIADTSLARHAGVRELSGPELDGAINKVWNATYKPLVDKPVPVPNMSFSLLPDLQSILAKTAGLQGSPMYRKDIGKQLYKLVRNYKTDELVATIKDLNTMADDAFAAAKPDTRLGHAMAQAADLLEARLATAVGPDKMSEYQAGRRAIAELAAMRKATIDPTGHIDMAQLGNMLRKRKPLTGPLYIAGQAAKSFPRVMGSRVNAETELLDRVSPGLGVSPIGGLFQALGAPTRAFLKGDLYQSHLREPGMSEPMRRALVAMPSLLSSGLSNGGLYGRDETEDFAGIDALR